MHRVPQLECKHRVGSQLTELSSELTRRESVFVKPIIPDYPSQHLYIPSNQPVTAVIDHPDIRMNIIEHSKLPRTSFLLLVFIELWVFYDGSWSPINPLEGVLRL